METAYLNNADFWRSPVGKPQSPDIPSRAPVDVNMSVYPMSSFDFDPLPNVFAFSACSNPYKEFAVLTEKGPHDIADALLSLKHAVVHPQFGGQLSPLSAVPASHVGQSISPSAMSSPQSPQPLYYSPQMMSPPYSSPTHGHFAPPPPQYGSEHSQAFPPHQGHQHNMFPAMSVNVSMSMNVGVPPNHGGGNQYTPYHQQWHEPVQQQLPHCTGNNGGGLHSQYNGYPAQSYPYKSYALNADLRVMHNERDFFYKSTDTFKEAARVYTANHLKRARILRSTSREGPIATTPEPAKVNLCRICGKTYARPSTLKTHLRTHSGEKPYKCSTCNKSFSQAANLTAHIRTHSGEKPFRCPICDRRFSQSSSVTTHMRTHSGERPYRCRLCKKAFSDSSTLTKHLRIHSGEKPYQCKLCMLRFSQSGNLNRHMRVHTNNA